MNRFSVSRTGYKMPGVDKPYYDADTVIWYTNGIIACSPRRLRLREFNKVRWARKGYRHVFRRQPMRMWDGAF